MKLSVYFSLVIILLAVSLAWALSEEEYARMAAENLRMMHEAKEDSQAMTKASEDFVKQFSPQQIEEYIAMANQIMQDKALAGRISTKVMERLKKMGYRVNTSSPGDVNAIVIEE